MITPSTPKARHGCSESSMAISGVSERSRNGILFEYSRNAGWYRPACRISHTGVRSTASPLAARSRMSCCAPASGLGAFLSCSADKPQPDGPTMAAGAAARRMDERDAVTPDAATRSSRARRKRLFIAIDAFAARRNLASCRRASEESGARASSRVREERRAGAGSVVAERPHARPAERRASNPFACLVKKLRDCCSCDAIPTSKPKVRRLDCEASRTPSAGSLRRTAAANRA